MYNNIEKRILVNILNAQAASDEAKIRKNQKMASSKKVFVIKPEYNIEGIHCYKKKDICTKEAVRLINSVPVGKITYSIKKDANNRTVIYFNIKTNGGTKQVSFHTFLKGMNNKLNTGVKTRWQKSAYGPAVCRYLQRELEKCS